MGQRTPSETVVAILQSFLSQRTWSQADLARQVDVSVRVVRAKLCELEQMGVPFETETDHPHVYWSVPPDWVPGGIAFDRDQLSELLRLLRRIPASRARDGLLKKVAGAIGAVGERRAAALAHLAPDDATRLDPMEETQLPLVEDAHDQRNTLRFSYFSATRGNLEERDASVHAIVHGPPARFVGTCHRDGTLKWFRVDRVVSAKVVPGGFRPANGAELAAFQTASLSGFYGGSETLQCSFVVRNPEARWVQRNLPKPMSGELLPDDSLRVTVETSALLQVARFIVGLGEAARAETPVLRSLVENLARGSLRAHGESA